MRLNASETALHAYSRLVRLAHRLLRREPPAASYDTHELVQETYEKLVRQREPWSGPDHVYGIAQVVMKRILIDRARRKQRLKRQVALTTLHDGVPEADCSPERIAPDQLASLVTALERLRAVDERQARVVELRFVVGKTSSETAEILGVTRRTVDRDWVHARCWLRRELSRLDPADGSSSKNSLL